jgi:hypothetical protein
MRSTGTELVETVELNRLDTSKRDIKKGTRGTLTRRGLKEVGLRE